MAVNFIAFIAISYVGAKVQTVVREAAFAEV